MTALTRTGALVVLSAAQFLIALDYSIVQLALPRIAADLDLSTATPWVLGAYAVPFAGFLVVGGRLTDRYGPRRLFIVAVLGFGLASAVGGLATAGPALLAARAGQGLAAGLLQPAVLGLIGTTYPAGAPRSRALAVWSSVGASGLAAGVLLGGVLTTASWRLTFAVFVPVTLACAVGALITITPVGPGATAGPLPVRATLTGTGAVLAVVAGLTLGAHDGWGAPVTLGALASAAGLAAVFVHSELSPRTELIGAALRRTRSLRLGAVATALYMASVGSEFYLLTLLLQDLDGYPPLAAGLAFLPLTVGVGVAGALTGRLVRRYPAASVLAAAFGLSAAGLGWLAVAPAGGYLGSVLPGLVASGLGHGAVYTSMFVLGTRDVPAARQGSAGALLTTAQYVAGAVTVALLSLVLGTAPGPGEFRAAFALTAATAVLGAVVVAVRSRQSTVDSSRSAVDGATLAV